MGGWISFGLKLWLWVDAHPIQVEATYTHTRLTTWWWRPETEKKRVAEAEAGRQHQHHPTELLVSRFHLFTGLSDECRQGICRCSRFHIISMQMQRSTCTAAERQRMMRACGCGCAVRLRSQKQKDKDSKEGRPRRCVQFNSRMAGWGSRAKAWSLIGGEGEGEEEGEGSRIRTGREETWWMLGTAKEEWNGKESVRIPGVTWVGVPSSRPGVEPPAWPLPS